MGRTSILLTVAVLVLAALPGLPGAVAQTGSSGAALVVLYADEFDGSDANGWRVTTLSASPTDSWHRVRDGNATHGREVWFASRISDNKPDGYRNDVDARLLSPTIDVPAGFVPRSVALSVRGSSEADVDTLTLEWAPTDDTPDSAWKPLQVWSGSDLASTYEFKEYTSPALLQHRGDFVARLRFDSDATCDSQGDPDGEPVRECGPAFDSPAPDPVGVSGEVPPLCDGDGAYAGCQAYAGWFIDSFLVIGRRDFVAAAPADAARLPLDSHGSALTVDLLGDRGKLIDFRLDPAQTSLPADTTAVLVTLDRTGSSDLLNIAAAQGTDGVWSALLAVDEPDLITGTWSVQFFAVRDQSGSLVATRTLTVSAQDATPPRLTVSPAGDPIHLGPGSVITVDVGEPFLRRVTYSFTGLPAPLDLPFPYVLPEAALPEGISSLTIKATDRTGHETTSTIAVDRDTQAPTLTVVAPDLVYAGVPFDLGLDITERSAHTIRLDANGTLLSFEVPAGSATLGKVTNLQLTAPDLGNMTVQVRVNDTMGNEVVLVRQFTAVEPVTDLQVTAVRLTSPFTAISREGHVITAVLEQKGGVAPLPVTVTFEGAGRVAQFNATVPISGPLDVVWNVTLPPGIHEVRVTAVGPAIANETAPGDEHGSLMVESFLGRITVGSQVYNIRADTRGLPAQVVLSGTSKTFPLSLIDSDRGVAYRFVAEGNRTIVWDPLVPVQVVPTSSGTTSDPGDKDAPAPGIALALLVVALAALAQRRRK